MSRPRIAVLMDENTSGGGFKGPQWGQELLGPDHPGRAIFAGFVDACRKL